MGVRNGEGAAGELRRLGHRRPGGGRAPPPGYWLEACWTGWLGFGVVWLSSREMVLGFQRSSAL